MENQIIFNKVKFSLLPSGYYISQGLEKPQGLHVYIWEFYSGKKVPKGWIVHHLDEDKSNNGFDNLVCMSRRDHALAHKNNLSKDAWEMGIEKARQWHSSEEGHKFHVENGKNTWINKQEVKTNCVCCKKEFHCFFESRRKYCSTKCRQIDYAQTGKGHENRTCLVCGEIFLTSKFKKALTCSRSCSNRIRGLKCFGV